MFRLRHLIGVLILGVASSANAQTTPDLSGKAYIDFAHFLDSQEEDLRGNSYFSYRRIYLTSDFKLPSNFSARLRIEADESSAVPTQPDVRLKDAYVRWQFHEGHRATIGIQPPPVFDVSENAWGYRGLEQTLIDLSGMRSSRALGLHIEGRLSANAALQYRMMIANSHDTRPQADHLKHGFAQLVARSGPWTATFGANYVPHGDSRSGSLMISGVIARVSETGRAGVDWFVQRTNFTSTDDDASDAGISLFLERSFASNWSVVARLDRFSVTDQQVRSQPHTFALAGLSYQPIEQIRIVPNVYLLSQDDVGHDDARLRLTVILEI